MLMTTMFLENLIQPTPADANAFTDWKIQGWRVLEKSARVTAFKQQDFFQAGQNDSLVAGRVRWQPRVIFTIEIQRTTTYVLAQS